MTHLPQEWQAHQFGDVITIQYGYPFRSNQFTEEIEDIKLLRGDNIAPGRIRWDGVRRWPSKNVSDVQPYLLSAGDVVVAMDRPVIGAGLRQSVVCEADLPCLLVQRIACLRPSDAIDRDFLACVVASQPFTDYIVAVQTGAAAPHISGAQIANFCVHLPSLPEQRRIAKILDEADVAVRTMESLIAAKLKYKNVWVERLLNGKDRFPEFSGQEWKTHLLGDLFRERVETNRPDLRLLAVTGSEGVVDRDTLAKRDASNPDKSKYLRVVPGDIAYNTMRMWQGVFGLSSIEGIVSPAYTVCVPEAGIDGIFAAQLFKLPAQIALFHRYSQGLVSDTLNLKFPAFARIKVKIPSIGEQRKIAGVLSLIDEEISLLRRQLSALKAQKQGLMQKLLTGEVRVKEFAP